MNIPTLLDTQECEITKRRVQAHSRFSGFDPWSTGDRKPRETGPDGLISISLHQKYPYIQFGGDCLPATHAVGGSLFHPHRGGGRYPDPRRATRKVSYISTIC